MSFNRWMDKQTVIHPYRGILFDDKKKSAIKPQKYMKKLESSLVKDANLKGPILYDFNHMTFWKRRNYVASKMIHGF